MITKRQIEEFSERLKIDQFTIFREYLQIFLIIFIKKKRQRKFILKGRTCLHLFFAEI
jgi:hypothetical protein